MRTTRWKVRLGVEAEKDFVRILKYTADTFGEWQASIYKAKLTDAIAALESGPDAPGSVSRDEILPNLRSLHVDATAEEGDISSCIAPQRDRSSRSCAFSMTPWIWPDTFREKPLRDFVVELFRALKSTLEHDHAPMARERHPPSATDRAWRAGAPAHAEMPQCQGVLSGQVNISAWALTGAGDRTSKKLRLGTRLAAPPRPDRRP